MARKTNADETNAAISATQPNFAMPEDRNEATRWIYRRVHKLMQERKWLAEDVKVRLKAAKEKGMDGAAIRTAAKLRRLTPEKRVKWEASVNAAVAILGYSPLEAPDMAPDISKTPVGKEVEAVQRLETEKVEIGKRISEMFAIAKDAELDVPSIRIFLRMSSRDATEIQDWFDGLDITGKTLGLWDANSFDLHDEAL